MRPEGVLCFSCASCGKEYSVDPRRLPPAGAKAPCRQCGAALEIFPDGRLVGARTSAPRGPDPRSTAPPARPAPPPSAPPPPRTLPAPPAGAPPLQPGTFQCPSCGHLHRADLSRVPGSGVSGKCGRCAAALTLFPDGTVRGPRGVAIRPGAAGSAASSWEIEKEGQALGPFSTDEMKDLVKAGRLLPDHLVRPVRGSWTLLAACPDLCPPPVPEMDDGARGDGAEEERWGSPQECHAHPQAAPAFECTQCQRYLCPACVRESPIRGSTRPITMCTACGGLAKPLENRETWTPFYRDMGQVLTAPLKGHALLYFGILSFLQILKIPAAFGWMWGLAAVFILTVFQTSFYLHLIQQVANGSYEFPEWPESSNFVDMIVSVLKVIFVSVVSLIPAILVAVVTGVGALGLLLGGAAAGGHALAALGPVAAAFLALGFFYLFYLPMCITIVAVFDTVLPALNPFLILKIMFRIGLPYVAAIAVLTAMTIWDATFSAFLFPVPIIGKVLAAPISVYCSLVSCYVLGRVVHENEERIGWH